MPKAWLCIPSIRPEGGTVKLWLERGYGVCLVRQGEPVDLPGVVNIPTSSYLGWAASINLAVAYVMEHDRAMTFCVGGGDDTEPDPNHSPDEIADQCSEYLAMEVNETSLLRRPEDRHPEFGVMQPIGDILQWPNSRIDNFAGSPWMGREWCRRAHGGRGPLYAGFHHNFGDEHLQCVAIKLGIFWQRMDLIHKHNHALREPGGVLPEFLKPVFSPEHWQEAKGLFLSLKAGGFAEAYDLLPARRRDQPSLEALA